MRVYEAARSLYQTFLLKLNAEPGTLVASRCFHVPCRRAASLLTSLPLSIVHCPPLFDIAPLSVALSSSPTPRSRTNQ
jgi:hypothetical protein